MYTTQGYFIKTNNKYMETFADNLLPEDPDSTKLAAEKAALKAASDKLAAEQAAADKLAAEQAAAQQGASTQGAFNQGASNQGISNQRIAELRIAEENMNKIKEQQDMINELQRQMAQMANQKITERPRNKGPLDSFVDKAYYEKLLTLLNKEISDNTDLGIVSEKKILNLSIKDIAVLGANQDRLTNPKV